MFTASFYGSWMLFGGFYFLICYLHGDFADGEEERVPCIEEVDGFASSFLFSLETQHTIGYGSRQTTTECPLAMLVVSLQVGTATYYRQHLQYSCRQSLVVSFKPSWWVSYSLNYQNQGAGAGPLFSASKRSSVSGMGGSALQ